MNSFNRITVLSLLLPLSACSSHFDRRINPPAQTQWVTLSVKVPKDIETLPMDVLYRSQICQEVAYDNTTESHTKLVPAHSPHDVPLVQQGNSDLYQAKVALKGGGKCDWSLSVVRMRMQFKPDSSLAKGKDTIPSSTSFVFDELGNNSSLLAGPPREVYGDQEIKITYFPMIFIGHISNETSLELFSGDKRQSKWSRTFRVHNTKELYIEPILKNDKTVIQESPKPQLDKVTVTYPDGSVVYSDDIDYDKLLSIK